MIFVTVGSQKFPFDRLIKKVDEMIRENLIEEEVIIQTGTSTTANFLKAWSFYEPDRHNGSCVCSNIQSLSYS